MEKGNESFEFLLEHGFDISKRRLYLHSELDRNDGGKAGESSPEILVRSLHYLDSQNKKDIELWINTPGGSIAEMFGLYDVIQSLSSRVITIGFGEVCSAGCLILACGAERYVTPNCFFMFHTIQYRYEERSTEDIYALENTLHFDKRLWSLWLTSMSKHSKHSKNWWVKQAKEKKDVWFGAKEMKTHGVIDGIYGVDYGPNS